MEFDYKRLWNKKIGKFELGEEMEKDIFRPFMSVGKRKKFTKRLRVQKRLSLFFTELKIYFLSYSIYKHDAIVSDPR